jgi:hypothetical protein
MQNLTVAISAARIIRGCGVLPYTISQARRLFAARSAMLIGLCSATLLIATSAYAKQLGSGDVAAAPKIAASGWWSGADATQPAQNSIVSMADLTRFEPTGSTSSSTAAPGVYQLTNLPSRGFSAPAHRSSLPQVAPISQMETNYLQWELKLVDTLPVEMNRNGVLPLAEVDYAGWHLPITLYTSRLHEIDER